MKFLILFSTFLLCKVGFSQPTIYWSQYANGIHSLNTSNIDGTNQKMILSSSVFDKLSYDSINNEFYVLELNKKEVLKYNVKTKEQSTFFSTISEPVDIHFNQTENVLYIVDGKNLLKVNINGSYTIIANNLSKISSFTMDESKKILFWSTTDGNIISSNYDGSNKKTIITAQSNPDRITLNKDKLYWMSYCGLLSCSGVFNCNLDGSNLTKSINEFVGTFTVSKDSSIFYTNTIYSGKIYISDLKGNNENTYYSGSTNAQSLYFSLADTTLYFSDKQYRNTFNSYNAGGLSKLMSSSVYYVKNITFDTLNKKIIWINTISSFLNDKGMSIARSNYDGSNAEILVDNSGLSRPGGVGVNPEQNKMYFCDYDRDAIYTSGLDGKKIYTLLYSQKYPKDLIVDKKNKRLIWISVSNKSINSCDFDGKNQKIIYSDQASNFNSLFVNFEDETLFWFDNEKKIINSIKIDGSGVKEIVKVSDSELISSLCYYNNRIYWSDEQDRVIRSCNLDGQDIKTILQFSQGSSNYSINIFDKKISNTLKELTNSVIKIQISPNPFKTHINIQCEYDEVGSISCFDISGRIVKTFRKMNLKNCSLDLADIKEDIFIVNILLENGESFSYLLNKE